MIVTGASSSCAAMLYDARIRSVFLRGGRMRQGKAPMRVPCSDLQRRREARWPMRSVNASSVRFGESVWIG
jgi:hypothetical protein